MRCLIILFLMLCMAVEKVVYAEEKVLGDERMTVEEAKEVYYIKDSCVDSTGCDKNEELIKDKELLLTDFLMYEGDLMYPQIRAQLPSDGSRLVLSFGGTRYVFGGTMIVCVDYDPKRKGIRIKLFQAGKFTAEVRYADQKTQIVIRSGNTLGIRWSEVRVDEGSVEFKTDWLCDSCFGYRKFFVKAGGCVRHDLRGAEDDADEANLNILEEDPAPFDHMLIQI